MLKRAWERLLHFAFLGLLSFFITIGLVAAACYAYIVLKECLTLIGG